MLLDKGASESKGWSRSLMRQLRSLMPQFHHLPTRCGSGRVCERAIKGGAQNTQPRTCRLTHIHMRPTPIHAAVPQKKTSAPPRCAVGAAGG